MKPPKEHYREFEMRRFVYQQSGTSTLGENPSVTKESDEKETPSPEEKKDELKTGVEENRKKIEAAVASIATFAIWLLSKNDPENPDEEEVAKNALNELNSAKIIKSEQLNEKENYEKKTRYEEEDLESCLVNDMDMIAINARDILTEKRKLKLEKQGIHLRTSLIKMSSTAFFRKNGGISTYEKFEKAICKGLLFPELKKDDKPTEEQIAQTATALSQCSIGKYQIRPFLHFAKIDLTCEGAAGLKNMWKFLKSEELQNKCNREIILKELGGEENPPDFMAMAAGYYYGKARKKMKVLQTRMSDKEIKQLVRLKTKERSGTLENDDQAKMDELSAKVGDADWLFKKQKFGRSIAGYAVKAMQYMDGLKKKYPEEDNVSLFQMVLAKKETGYLRGKKLQPAAVS